MTASVAPLRSLQLAACRLQRNRCLHSGAVLPSGPAPEVPDANGNFAMRGNNRIIQVLLPAHQRTELHHQLQLIASHAWCPAGCCSPACIAAQQVGSSRLICSCHGCVAAVIAAICCPRRLGCIEPGSLPKRSQVVGVELRSKQPTQAYGGSAEVTVTRCEQDGIRW